MAYIANTAFETKVSNHEFDSQSNITGVFYNAPTPRKSAPPVSCARKAHCCPTMATPA